jgi:hypothetical protein
VRDGNAASAMQGSAGRWAGWLRAATQLESEAPSPRQLTDLGGLRRPTQAAVRAAAAARADCGPARCVRAFRRRPVSYKAG